jgi:Na+/H+ antiporter NhaD/arsenite permease-like protein
MLFLAEASGHQPVVTTGVTVFFALLLVGMIAALALEEKLHAKKSLITGIAAIVSLFLAGLFGLLPQESATLGGHELHLPVYVAAIDWEVIAIILGASLFVDVTSKSGIFTWVAVKLTKLSGGDPLRLLVSYGILTVLFSAFLSNVTAMIIVGSLTAVSLGRLGMKDKLLGFLLVEGLLTNVGGLLTLISSVPNIIVGNTAGISFLSFFLVAAPYVLITTAVTLWMGKRIFQIEALASDETREAAREKVAGFDENDGIKSDRFFWVSTAAFVLFVFCLALQSVLPVVGGEHGLGMGFIALTFAGALLVIYKHQVDKFYSATDWDLLAFFGSLFVVIYVMERALVLERMGEGLAFLLSLGDSGGKLALLFASAGLSSVTDNIPLAAMLAKILGGPNYDLTSSSMEWWAVIFGANLGGNITPIGSASTVVAVTIMARHKVPLSFLGFVRKAAPFAAVQLVLAAIYVFILNLVM